MYYRKMDWADYVIETAKALNALCLIAYAAHLWGWL